MENFLDQLQAVISIYIRCLKVIGKLYDQDPILGYEADERDNSDLTKDVQALIKPIQTQQGACDCHRNRKHDDQRIAKAFKLRRKDHIDEE